VERAGCDDVFNSLEGGAAAVAGCLFGAKSCGVRSNERMARDEANKGGEVEDGEDCAVAAFRTLYDQREFACWRDGEGNVCLRAAVVVSPAGAPCIDGRVLGDLSLVTDGGVRGG
jgi:hypothetical protein